MDKHILAKIATDNAQATGVDKKTNLRYLTAVFPMRYGYARRLAERLNKAKKRSIMGKAYSANIIVQVIDKGWDDLNVEPGLINMVEEYTGKKVEEAAPNYVR